MKHHAAAVASIAGKFYTAYCDCGWSDFPRLTWTNATRDITYHLHTIGQHPFNCHYCRDAELGIPAPTAEIH